MHIHVRSPDFRIDDLVQDVLARTLADALAIFAGKIGSVRVSVSAVPGHGEAPRTRCRIRVHTLGAARPDVLVAHVAGDLVTAIARAAEHAQACVARVLLPEPAPVH